MINKFRKFLIRLGKILPFIICFLVGVNYIESIFALIKCDYLLYDGCIILNTPISFLVGSFSEYNLQFLIVLITLSIAIETCIYNKLTCLYLAVNLFEKSYFNFELEPIYIYVICVTNIIIAGYLTWKGIKVLL